MTRTRMSLARGLVVRLYARLGTLRLTPASLGAAVLALALADWGSQLAGSSIIPGGPVDELAHVLTTLLVLWALGRSTCDRFLGPALIASVAIDLDHLPGTLGVNWLTAGTPRPYTHSLLTLVIVVGIGIVVRSRRDVLLGIALGLVGHFVRDLAEPGGGVALLWPWSDHSFSVPHATYLGAMAAVAIVCLVRVLVERQRRRRSPEPLDARWLSGAADPS